EGRHDELALSLVTSWVANPGAGQSARLAPPVVELIQGGAAVERRVADFGLDWPLPVADGV
ncbi:MAG TPA: hypothetical protein VIL49_10175, partial [Capillimicrobium sp.]